MLPVADWWHCLPSPERFVVLTLLVPFQSYPYATSCALVNITATGVGLVGDRRLAFDRMFGLTYTSGLPFPPPADCLCEGAKAIWDAINEYTDEHGTTQTQCECGPLAQPGQQGGAWPDCWP